MVEKPSVTLSTRETFSLRRAAPVGEEIDHPTDPPKKRGGKIGRFATTLTAAALVAACSSSPTVKPTEAPPETTKTPGVEQVHIPTAQEIFTRLTTDPEVKKDQKIISFTDLKKQYQDSDYVPLSNPGSKSIGKVNSAPVLLLTYDHASGQLSFKDQTPKGLSKQDTYNLLSSVMNNEVLQTALKIGKIDKLAIRLNSKMTNPLYKDTDGFDGLFLSKDKSDADKGTQHSMYFFLLGNQDTLNTLDFHRIGQHEGLHSLLADNILSLSNEIKPNLQEFSEWKQVCVDMRNFALADMKKYRQNLLTMMKGKEKLFPTERAKSAWQEIYQALQNGEFDDSYQLHSTDLNLTGAKMGLDLKIPECTVIGPWESFMQIIYDPKTDLPDLFSPAYDPVDDVRVAMVNEWAKIMNNQTIYKIFREGPYDERAGAEAGTFGHIQTDWDEATTSINDTILDFPEWFAEKIKQLPTDRKAVSLKFIDLAVKALDASVPQDQIIFHINLRTRYELFKAELAK